MLRGQQTLGELRTRTERMYHFADLEAVQRTLDDLVACPAQPLAKYIPAGGGRRAATFVQLLTGDGGLSVSPGHSAPQRGEEIEPSWREKVEADIAELRAEIHRLKTALGEE
jgi:uncharacterized protein YceH (UPF0502 family)